MRTVYFRSTHVRERRRDERKEGGGKRERETKRDYIMAGHAFPASFEAKWKQARTADF